MFLCTQSTWLLNRRHYVLWWLINKLLGSVKCQKMMKNVIKCLVLSRTQFTVTEEINQKIFTMKQRISVKKKNKKLIIKIVCSKLDDRFIDAALLPDRLSELVACVCCVWPICLALFVTKAASRYTEHNKHLDKTESLCCRRSLRKILNRWDPELSAFIGSRHAYLLLNVLFMTVCSRYHGCYCSKSFVL